MEMSFQFRLQKRFGYHLGARSDTVGIPNGRIPPSLLGSSTRWIAEGK